MSTPRIPPDYADPEPLPARPADRFLTAIVILCASIGFFAGALFMAVIA